MLQYFQMLRDVLTEHNLLNSPAQIYNVDETGMPMDHRPPRVLTKRGRKRFGAARLVTRVKLL